MKAGKITILFLGIISCTILQPREFLTSSGNFFHSSAGTTCVSANDWENVVFHGNKRGEVTCTFSGQLLKRNNVINTNRYSVSMS